MENQYELLFESLTHAKDKNWITLLKRGVTKGFAFNQVNLDIKHNNIEDFAKMLFFYGEKAKYFWNDRLKTTGQLDFGINDTSTDFFKFIFNEFGNLINNDTCKRGTKNYFNKNKEAITYFKEKNNIQIFTSTISKLSEQEKVSIRNYYLTILHQLGEHGYKDNSHFVSGTRNVNIAERFGNSEIVINFWQPNFNKTAAVLVPNQNLPQFIGKPYKNQNELSVFTVILPHFIYSFKFKGELYLNPAIEKITNFEIIALTGLDIDQENITRKSKEDTNFRGGVMTDGTTYQEFA